MHKYLWAAAFLGVLAGPLTAAGATSAESKPLSTNSLSSKSQRHWVYDPGNSPIVADVGGRPITKAMVELKFIQMTPREQPPPTEIGAQSLLDLLIQKAYVAWLLDEKGYKLTQSEDSSFKAYRITMLRNELRAQLQDRAAKVTRD